VLILSSQTGANASGSSGRQHLEATGAAKGTREGSNPVSVGIGPLVGAVIVPAARPEKPATDTKRARTTIPSGSRRHHLFVADFEHASFIDFSHLSCMWVK
jgi:hypothetical protein